MPRDVRPEPERLLGQLELDRSRDAERVSLIHGGPEDGPGVGEQIPDRETGDAGDGAEAELTIPLEELGVTDTPDRIARRRGYVGGQRPSVGQGVEVEDADASGAGLRLARAAGAKRESICSDGSR